MYRAPALGLGPRATPPAPGLCVPTLGYQVFGQQSKLVPESISHWHYPSEQRSPSAEAQALTTPTPNSRCSPRTCHQNTGTWAAQSRRNQCRKTQVGSCSRAARPPLPDPPGGREGVLVQRLAGHVVAVSKDRPPRSSVSGCEEERRGARGCGPQGGRPAEHRGGSESSGRRGGATAEDGVRGGVRGVGASQRRLSPPLASWAGCRGRQGSSGKGS